MDGWDGYAAALRRITQGCLDANVRNAVVLTGDVHRSWANYVKVDYKDSARPCGGRSWCARPYILGNGTGSTTDPVNAWNAQLKFTNDNRGYVNTRIAKDAMTADFRVLGYVTKPGSPVSTKASLMIRDGVPGLATRA